MTRSPQIDLLRILGCSLIFYYHGGLLTGWPLSRWGQFAVTTFIYITAFCALRFSRMEHWGAYVISKLKALYPTFLVITLALFVGSFIHKPAKTSAPYTAADLVANLFMLSGFLGKAWFSTPMWFMPFVMQIYLVMPFLKRIRLEWIEIIISFLVAIGLTTVIWQCWPGQTGDICQHQSPIFRAPEIIVAACVARAATRRDMVVCAGVYLIGCVLTACLAAAFCAPLLPLAFMPLRGILVFAVLSGLVYILMRSFDFKRGTPALSLLGRASFPFFLAHGAGVAFVYERWGSNIAAWIAYFLVCWAGSIGCVFIVDGVFGVFRQRNPSTVEVR